MAGNAKQRRKTRARKQRQAKQRQAKERAVNRKTQPLNRRMVLDRRIMFDTLMRLEGLTAPCVQFADVCDPNDFTPRRPVVEQRLARDLKRRIE